MIVAKLRRYLYHLRHSGLKGLLRYIKLSTFERKIFNNKSLQWNNQGYWKMHPMPTKKQLKKFYSEIYWLNNKFYKSRLLIERDLSHFKFLEEKLLNKLKAGSVMMNYGAGHGGISYLAAAKNLEIINIEPAGVYTGELNNFLNFPDLEDFFNSKENFQKVDIFYSSHTLEHLTDPILFFKDILRLIDQHGKVILEVPNCRVANPGDDYNEGGCNGKLAGNHTLFFTRDFFDKMNAEIFLFSGDVDNGEYIEVSHENDAKCIRVIIDADSIFKWISKI